ncbi:peptidase S16 [Roseateles sp. DAIF2]|uniref:LON peptidase substrate-binding domain-containing protein n=1 Tax=Roseateles sp. DAIF2 TaxID=2714952 RepID=UPI0018A2F431|nr:LON peptidase substrate-binding domain-containing protein [Roseateles sp. DAIF2]QPF72827.1 peptidase S16 [Roseateles sp. DAIF2]
MQIALFPLQAPLFPGGLLSLRVFEPRYLDLIQRCEKSGEPFGVVLLTAGSEVRQRGEGADFVAERFEPLGTLAHLERLERPRPGLLQIRCTGGRRFRLSGSACLPHGLWMGEGELLPEEVELPLPEDLAQTARLLQGLLHTLETGAAAEDLPVQPPYRWDDCGWLANRWCELLPLPADEKQRLLALDNPLLRLELIGDQLERLRQP